MRTLRNSFSVMALFGAFVLVACGTDAPAPATEASTPMENRYGFVSIVDGTMGVVDLSTMSVVNTIKESQRASHMLHALSNGRDVLYGDWDTNDILVISFSEDMKSYEVADRIPSPVQMHGFMTLGADDRYIAVFSRLELQANVLFTPEHDDSSLAIFDRDTRTWRKIALDSPSLGTIGPDGLLYVSNVHHKNIAVVDVERGEVLQRITTGPETWVTGDTAIGPKDLKFSPDGRTLVTADYEGLTLTVFDVTSEGLVKRKVMEMDGAPKSIEFTRDGKELWVVTYDLNVPREELLAKAGDFESMGDWYEGPQPADEAGNASRSTTMHVLDTATLEEVGSFSTRRGMISPKMGEDANVVYVTTSAGSVYAIDRTSFDIIGEALVGGIGRPVICGNLAHQH